MKKINFKDLKNKIKKSFLTGLALAVIFYPNELNKSNHPYHKVMIKEIDKLHRFKKNIINYPTTDYYSRKGIKINSIIVHTTDSDSEKKSLEYFSSNNECNVHYLIGKDGLIYSLAPEEFATYHAGSYFNRRSIGIEIVQGIGRCFFCRKKLITPAQIDNSVTLIKILMEKYDISKENIIGHHEFNRKKGDPGERNMGAILSRID